MSQNIRQTQPELCQNPSMKKIIFSGMIGNALEWYDYALYGHCAIIISRLFFPFKETFIGLIATFGVFAAGFVIRPLGAIFFGYLGDQYGRKMALSSAILLMAIPTSFIGLLPTYEQIGLLAPILLIIIRLLQGLSLGGECSGAMVFLIEHSPPKHRSLIGSSIMCSTSIGILMGSLFATIISGIMPTEDFENWGWRILFLSSFFIGGIGWYIRKSVHESPLYENLKKDNSFSSDPIKELFLSYKKQVIIGLGIYFTVTIPFYILTVFINTFAVSFLKYSLSEALILSNVATILLVVLIPIFGWLADYYSKKYLLLIGAVGFLCFSLPIFWLITQKDFIYVGLSLFSLLLALYIAPFPATFAELFPTRIRYTGLALTYNLSATIFGGTAPLTVTWLINKTESYMSIALYMMIGAVISIFALFFYQENQKAIDH